MIKEGNVKMTAKEFYETIGQNYEEVLERLAGSEALVLRFLKKFSTDKTFSELEKAMEARDIEMIFRQSHTLKGVAGTEAPLRAHPGSRGDHTSRQQRGHR